MILISENARILQAEMPLILMYRSNINRWEGLYISNIWGMAEFPRIPKEDPPTRASHVELVYGESAHDVTNREYFMDTTAVLLPDGRVILNFDRAETTFVISPVAPSGEAIGFTEGNRKECFWAWSGPLPYCRLFVLLRNDSGRDIETEDAISWYYQRFTNSLTPAQMEVEKRYRIMCRSHGIDPSTVTVRKWFDKPVE
jgi:hypothetical protein